MMLRKKYLEAIQRPAQVSYSKCTHLVLLLY